MVGQCGNCCWSVVFCWYDCPSLLMELGRPSLGPFPVAIRIPLAVAIIQPYVMLLVFADPSETAST